MKTVIKLIEAGTGFLVGLAILVVALGLFRQRELGALARRSLFGR